MGENFQDSETVTKDLLEMYEIKKQEIRKRLEEFKNVFNQPDESLFSELAFCILTPQSKATTSWNAVKSLQRNNLLLKGSAEQIRPFLQAVRFPENKSRYLIEARKLFSENENLKVKEKLSEVKDNPLLFREWLVKNVKGLGMKEASLPYDEKILVIKNNIVEVMEIGNFIHNYKNGIYKNDKLETFSLNLKTLKIKKVPITNVFKHRYKKDLYKIKLVTGRSVKVTGDHSIFSITNGLIVPVQARELKIGDFIVVPRLLPIQNSCPVKINIVEKFLKYGINNAYLRSKSYNEFITKKYKLGKRKNQYTQKFRGLLPISILRGLPKNSYSIDLLRKHDVVIGFRPSHNYINSVIELDHEIFWLLGLIAAEGYVGRNPIEITLGSDEYSRALKTKSIIERHFGSKVYFLNNSKFKNSYTIKVHNLGFFFFLNKIMELKGSSIDKFAPSYILSSNEKNIKSYLQGYWEGDGWKKSKDYLSISTRSENLANSTLLQFLMLRCFARNCMKKGNFTIDMNNITKPLDIKHSKNYNSWNDYLPVGNLLHKIYKKFNLKTKINGKHTRLYNRIITMKNTNVPNRSSVAKVVLKLKRYGTCKELKIVENLLKSDLRFLKIKEIEKLYYDKDFVYDIEVGNSNYHNFVGGFGGVFLHNSHFIRNTGLSKSQLAILDVHILKNLLKLDVIEEIPKSLTKKMYLDIESKMKKFSKKIGIDMDELDLLLWSKETGFIFK